MFARPWHGTPSRPLVAVTRPRWRSGASLATGIVAAVVLLACTPAGAPPQAGPGPAASPGAAAAAPTAPPARLPVRIGYGSITGNNLGLWVAHDAGLFAEQGLDVQDFPLIEGGTLVIQTLIAGDVQFVLAGSSGIIAAALRGADLVMLAGASEKFDFALIAVPSIRTGADLRGKRVGISRFGSSSDFAARAALDHLGVDADRDVSMLQVGGTSARLGALQSGAIDATPQIAPALLTAQKMGFNMLVDLSALGVPYQVGPISSTRAIVTESPELARRVVRGYLAGIHRMKTDKAFALEVSRRYLQTDDQAILEESWEHFALKVIAEVPYITDAGLAPVLRELATEDPQAASARPDQFYDNRFLREAEDSGFVRQLYGR
jgi:ABC-type nitrate/sulfonate/bicarbonate transport system substrate-binding protein